MQKYLSGGQHLTVTVAQNSKIVLAAGCAKVQLLRAVGTTETLIQELVENAAVELTVPGVYKVKNTNTCGNCEITTYTLPCVPSPPPPCHATAPVPTPCPAHVHNYEVVLGACHVDSCEDAACPPGKRTYEFKSTDNTVTITRTFDPVSCVVTLDFSTKPAPVKYDYTLYDPILPGDSMTVTARGSDGTVVSYEVVAPTLAAGLSYTGAAVVNSDGSVTFQVVDAAGVAQPPVIVPKP